MKYKLINTKTKEETICDKVTIDGFDYYVSNEQLKIGDNEIFGNTSLKYGWNWGFKKIQTEEELKQEFELIELTKSVREKNPSLMFKKVIATNNPNIDIPKVVDEVAKEAERDWIHKEYGFEVGYNPQRCVDGAVQKPKFINGYVKGYNKSQETHPFSEEDVREIFKIAQMQKNYGDYKPYTFEESIQLWKEQQPKIVYYEN